MSARQAASIATVLLPRDIKRPWKRNCDGGQGGQGGTAVGEGAVAGKGGMGGDGGNCSGSGDLSTGEIVGIVIGSLAGLCTIIGGVYEFHKWLPTIKKKLGKSG